MTGKKPDLIQYKRELQLRNFVFIQYAWHLLLTILRPPTNLNQQIEHFYNKLFLYSCSFKNLNPNVVFIVLYIKNPVLKDYDKFNI